MLSEPRSLPLFPPFPHPRPHFCRLHGQVANYLVVRYLALDGVITPVTINIGDDVKKTLKVMEAPVANCSPCPSY